MQLGYGFSKRDVRYELVINIQAAAYLLEDLTIAIRKSQDTITFDYNIDQLAIYLDTLVTVASSPNSPPEFKVGGPRPRLTSP